MKFARLKIMLLIVFATQLVIAPFLQTSNVKATPENRVYLMAPQTIDASTTEIFNVTAWFEGTVQDFFSYQIVLKVDDSIVKIENAWVPSNNPNWVFYGMNFIQLSPAFYDQDGDGAYEACNVGSCLYTGISVSGSKLLGIFKLRVVSAPAATLLRIDVTDPDETLILDSSQRDVSVTKQNLQINIVGQLVIKEPSQIIFTITPSMAAIGQEVIIEGRIEPLKPNVSVHIRIISDTTTTFSSDVKTDNKGLFNLTYIFKETDLPTGVVSYVFTVEVSWDGDETHYGSKSSAQITVFEPYSRIEINFAYSKVLAIGDRKANLPTPPVTVNVTVFNASDLYKWAVKIFFDPVYVNVSAVWLPTDSVFNLTGSDFNVTGPIFGFEDELGYFEFGAELFGGSGVYANGTLFQFNITGVRPTPLGEPTALKFSLSETFLLNSTGGTIFYTYKDLNFQVLGVLPVLFTIVNMATNKGEFLFYTTQVGLGYKFNATVRVEKAVNLYGWKAEITYNSTLLNVSRVLDPRSLPEYVFFDGTSNFTISVNQTLGIILAEGFLVDGDPFTGNGTLFVIEFEIAYIPSEESITCKIDFDPHGTFYFDGETWLSPDLSPGVYTLRYGSPPRAGVNVMALGAVVGGTAVILVALVVMKKTRRKELVFEDDLWEIEIEQL
ncbi:MAG: hypothetical protein QW175_03300 [Candidatus Bathyarchaeia archaeon]